MKEFQLSGTDLAQHLLEAQSLAWRETVEDQEEVTVTVEGSRLDVQETNQVLELDVALSLQVDLLARETLGYQVGFVEFGEDLGLPVTVSLYECTCQGLVTSLESLDTEERVMLRFIHCEDLFAFLQGHLDPFFFKALQYLAKFITFKTCFEPDFQIS